MNHRQQQVNAGQSQSRVGNALQSSRNRPPPPAHPSHNQQGRGLSAANTQRGPPPQLMVTVHGPDGRVQQEQYNAQQISRMQGHAPTAPLRTGHQYPHNVQYSPTSPFSTSSDTLIGSSTDSHKLSSSTNSSHSPGTTTSIRNMKLSVDPMLANSHADFENDRLASARPGGVSGGEFWKRFSTVLKDSERRMEMREKLGNSKGKGGESEWLEKEENRGKRYRIWVGIVALLIIAGIAGGVAYHFITKEKTDGSEVADQPTTHDFGLGTDGPSSSTFKESKKEAEETQVESLVTPQASSVGSGFTLHDRAMAMETAVPLNMKRRLMGGMD